MLNLSQIIEYFFNPFTSIEHCGGCKFLNDDIREQELWEDNIKDRKVWGIYCTLSEEDCPKQYTKKCERREK